MAGLVKLIDEKGKLVFLASWEFILLTVLMHLSQFRVWEGLLSQCKAVKEIRLLHIMPNGCVHVLQCNMNAHIHLLDVSPEKIV